MSRPGGSTTPKLLRCSNDRLVAISRPWPHATIRVMTLISARFDDTTSRLSTVGVPAMSALAQKLPIVTFTTCLRNADTRYLTEYQQWPKTIGDRSRDGWPRTGAAAWTRDQNTKSD